MNCEQVFQILTRGPFPSGQSSDAAVERHLRRCQACRRLAEALRPAEELDHETIGAVQRRDLPGYHGEIPPSGNVALASVLSSRLGHLWTRHSSGRTSSGQTIGLWMDGWRIATLVVFSAALGAMLYSLRTSDPSPLPHQPVSGGRVAGAPLNPQPTDGEFPVPRPDRP